MPGVFIQGADDTSIGDANVIPECPICYAVIGKPNDAGVTEVLIRLNCGHCFGHDCLATHLATPVPGDGPQRTCPGCRDELSQGHRAAIIRMRVLGNMIGVPREESSPITPPTTLRVRHEVGHTTTDDLPPLVRLYHPYEPLFETIQRIPLAAFRAVNDHPSHVDSHRHFAVHAPLLLSIYTNEELARINLLSQTYLLFDHGRDDDTTASVTIGDLFVAAHVVPGIVEEDRITLIRTMWAGDTIARLVETALQPTKRPIDATHRREMNEELLDRINRGRERTHFALRPSEMDAREGSSRMTAAVEHEARASSAAASFGRQNSLSQLSIPSSLRPSQAESAARRAIILNNNLIATFNNNLRDSPDPQPRLFPMRALYTPAEIRSIAIAIFDCEVYSLREGSESATGATVQDWLNEMGTTPPPGVEREVFERQRRGLEGLLEMIMRPVHRNLIFNGDTTLEHGISYFAGGASGDGEFPDEFMDNELRRRIINTSARAFELASLQEASGVEDDDAIARNRRYDLINTTPGETLQTRVIRAEYTSRELDEIVALLRFVDRETQALNIYLPIERFMQDEHAVDDLLSPYRLRLREIVFRPVMRLRIRRSETTDRDLADALELQRQEGGNQAVIETAIPGRIIHPDEVRRPRSPTATVTEARDRFWGALRPTPTPFPTEAGPRQPRVRIREVDEDAGDSEPFTEDEIGYREHTRPNIQALSPLERMARGRHVDPVLVDEDDFPETLQDIRFPRSRQQDGATAGSQTESALDSPSSLHDIQPPLGSRFSDYSSSSDTEQGEHDEDEEENDISLPNLTLGHFSEALMARPNQALSPHAAYLRAHVSARDRARLFVRMNGLSSELEQATDAGVPRAERTIAEFEDLARSIVREPNHARFDEAREFLNLLESIVETQANRAAEEEVVQLPIQAPDHHQQADANAVSPATAAAIASNGTRSQL